MNRHANMMLVTVVATAALALPQSAVAGPLGTVVRGMRDKSSSSAGESPDSPPADRSGDGSGNGSPTYERDWQRQPLGTRGPYQFSSGCFHCTAYAPAAVRQSGPPGQPPSRGVDMYGGLQAVSGSEVSGSVEIRGRAGWFGVELANTTFLEHFDKGGDVLRLDSWNVSSLWRLLGADSGGAPEVFATVGVAGVSTLDVQVVGVEVGLDARIPWRGAVSVFGDLGARFYQDDIRAYHGRAGVSLSFLQLSYRVTDFNTGPPLHGPEVGMQWRF